MIHYLVIVILLVILVIVSYKLFSYKTVTYYTRPSKIDVDFPKRVRNILSKSNWNSAYDIKETLNSNDAIITIKLTPRHELDVAHEIPQYYSSGKQIRFSTTTQGNNRKPIIDIDDQNWLHGVEESGLTLDQYRTYVIEHEFGHGLGKDHLPCTENVCPVMYQSTRGCPAKTTCGYLVSEKDIEGKKLTHSYL
jgi:hypothetical protein